MKGCGSTCRARWDEERDPWKGEGDSKGNGGEHDWKTHAHV